MYSYKTDMLGTNDVKDLIFPDCPVRNVLSRVADKWSLLVMHTLEERGTALRFSALQKALPDISKKMLAATLRNLEEDGFVTRTVYAEVPPRVEYALTPRASSFLSACRPMVVWAMDNLAQIIADRERFLARKN